MRVAHAAASRIAFVAAGFWGSISIPSGALAEQGGCISEFAPLERFKDEYRLALTESKTKGDGSLLDMHITRTVDGSTASELYLTYGCTLGVAVCRADFKYGTGWTLYLRFLDADLFEHTLKTTSDILAGSAYIFSVWTDRGRFDFDWNDYYQKLRESGRGDLAPGEDAAPPDLLGVDSWVRVSPICNPPSAPRGAAPKSRAPGMPRPTARPEQ